MILTDILLLLCLLLLVTLLLVLLFKKGSQTQHELQAQLAQTQQDIARIDPLLRSEFAASREETQRAAQAARQELGSGLQLLGEQLSKTIQDLSAGQQTQLNTFSAFLQTMIKNNEEKFDKLIVTNETQQTALKEQSALSAKETNGLLTGALQRNEEKTNLLVNNFSESSSALTAVLTSTAKENRKEQADSLKSFETSFSANVKELNELLRQKFNDLFIKQDQLKNDTTARLDKIRETVEQKLQSIRDDNGKKLEEMRVTVDEKLQSTLEKRFNDSFTVISERLELVHKGLGEMQTLAVSVGDIKKVMTNVKSRGVMGEYQLANILEDLLTNEQYEKNVKTKSDSGAIVEFAIKMPNNNSTEKKLWLPVDSKFPKEDYEALVDAYDDGDPVKLDNLRRAFKASIIKNARDIREKYIDPPNTTEYGIMFLPFESLYAEVLRTPGLFELLQKDYKITITGPTTLSALLNSLQMGFRTLAIEKRSSEVWDILSGVKTEFGKFGTVLEKTKKKLEEAANTISQAGVRSRAIERKLRDVQALPSAETDRQTAYTANIDEPDETTADETGIADTTEAE